MPSSSSAYNPSASGTEYGITAATQLLAPQPDGSSGATEEFSHLFATHEEWYKQASSRRQATFAALNEAVTELSTK